MTATLRGQEYLVLVQLRKGPWQTTDLAELFEMKSENVSRELQKLRKKGFVVTRQENPNDLRERQHYITDAGREHLDGKFYDDTRNPKTNRVSEAGSPGTRAGIPEAIPRFERNEAGQMFF